MTHASDNVAETDINILEEDDEFDRETEKLQNDGRINFPDKLQERLGLKPGDKVDFYYYKDSKSVKTLFIRKHVGGWFSPGKALKEIGLTAILIALLMPTFAFAQEVIQPATPTFTYRAGAAYFPLFVEVKYPAGFEDIERVNTISDLSPHSMNKILTPEGIIQKTFNTQVGDTFTFEFGQRYNVPVDQIATWVATANGQVVAEGSYPVKGTEFTIRLIFATSEAPHIPTDEELNAGVYRYLDSMNLKLDGATNKIDGGVGRIEGTLGVFSNWAGVALIVTVLQVPTTIMMWQVRNSMKPKKDHGLGYVNKMNDPKPPDDKPAQPVQKRRFWA